MYIPQEPVQHRRVDCGVPVPQIMARVEVFQLVRITSRLWHPVPQIMGKMSEVTSFFADSPRFFVMFWAPVSVTGAGGAGITRESDSRVDPAHVFSCSHCCVAMSLWTYTSHIKARV